MSKREVQRCVVPRPGNANRPGDIRGGGKRLWACALIVAGCGYGELPKPQFRPAESAALAMQDMDADGDGFLAEAEVHAAPGLRVAFPKYDANGDGRLSPAEIEARIAYYRDSPSWVVSGACRVLLDGKPLAGATVVFEPEPFLGSALQPCRGITDSQGIASVASGDIGLPGIHLGCYRVKVSQLDGATGQETIPARYNVHSELGCEADNAPPPGSSDGIVSFDLSPAE